jgi:hypothetical protein
MLSKQEEKLAFGKKKLVSMQVVINFLTMYIYCVYIAMTLY